MGKGLVWFRNNLRLHDNESLYRACTECDQLLCVYIFDPRQFGPSSIHPELEKASEKRIGFLVESVNDLSSNLNRFGGSLAIYQGFPEKIIPDLLQKHDLDKVYYAGETTTEELEVEQQLEDAINPIRWKIERYWEHCLYHQEDLPFSINNLPDIYTQFRKAVEKESSIRDEFPIPNKIDCIKTDAANTFSMEKLGYDPVKNSEKSVLPFRGGESAAWERLNHYFWKTEELKNYKYTRNGLLGADYSSKFSPWLSLGCISAKTIWHQTKRFEDEVKENISTYWLGFELIWRDYFWYVARKYGDRLFYQSGIKKKDITWSQDASLFSRWCRGETGVPFIDANMRELNHTGYMSNRGRQNVASFLVKDLGIDWRWGAAYFEQQLIDHDVCSNWGNWQYVAGIGNDPRENRYFNILSQARKYDSKGDYVRHWIPELQHITGFKVHTPNLLSDQELRERLDSEVEYPKPIIDMDKWTY